MTTDDKKYLKLLRSSCIAAIKQLEINYLALNSLANSGYADFNFMNENRIDISLYDAKVFLKNHPTNMVSDFLDESDYDKVLEECLKISRWLGHLLSLILPYDFKVDVKHAIYSRDQYAMQYQANPIPNAVKVPFSRLPNWSNWYTPSGLNRKFGTLP